jgi:UDP-3-O-acyl-N-acetylglucosamine deacetylase
MAEQPVDQEVLDWDASDKTRLYETTIGKTVSVSGRGTFFKRALRTLEFEPCEKNGWWFHRKDLKNATSFRVSISTLWNTTWNIVLCSGSPHNYMRMVEHIIALKLGMGVDNVIVASNSGDPPLFDNGSMPLVEVLEQAGIVCLQRPATYVTVKEPVTVGGKNGSFLTFMPATDHSGRLEIDCAIDFKSAIGKQRVHFVVSRNTFRHVACARTNTTVAKMLYCLTIGKIFADVRNLGYTRRNILIAGRYRYFNKPGMLYNNKSLEAVWHRAAMDLLAAVALIDAGRYTGKIVSYKSGHALDVAMIRSLYQYNLLEEWNVK